MEAIASKLEAIDVYYIYIIHTYSARSPRQVRVEWFVQSGDGVFPGE